MNIKDRVIIWYDRWCASHSLPSDLFDINAEIDNTLTFEENINIIEPKLELLLENGELLKQQVKNNKAESEREQQKAMQINAKLDVQRILKNNLSILMSKTNEAKTSFMCELIKEYKENFDGNVCAFGFKEELINKLNIKSFSSLLELENISNSIIFVDEVKVLLELENRKKATQVDNILRLVEHKGNKIFLSGLPSDFKKFICAKTVCFCYKSLEITDLINGSRAKEILLQYRGREIGSFGLHLPKEEVICYDGEFWKERFPYRTEWDTKLGNCDLFKEKIVQKCAKKVKNNAKGLNSKSSKKEIGDRNGNETSRV